MRTIKFRALSMCKGERWVYGDLRHYNRNPHTEKWTIHVPETGLETDVDEVTVGQFTGLRDKNGKEIYEGDFVYVDDLTSIYTTPYKGFVEQYRGKWCVCHYDKIFKSDFHQSLFFDDFAGWKTEVIGNIHDNPELLEAMQDE